MGVKIPFRKLQHFSLFTFLIIMMFSGSVRAQIAISDASFFEVAFTISETKIDNRSALVSVDDLSMLTGDSEMGVPGSWDGISTDYFGSYVEDFPGSVSVFGFKSAQSSDNIYSHVLFSNSSGTDFSALNIVFDFIYRPLDSQSGTLSLQVKSDNNRWADVPGGRIQLENMNGTVNGEWQSFSMQAAIDDIYVRSGDRFEFRWIFDDTEALQFPLALQRIELIPEESSMDLPEKGSVIITEIFSGTGEASSPDFIELYNPTDGDVSLKGVKVRSGENSFTVQSDLRIEPFSYIVLSRYSDREPSDFSSDYSYPDRLITPGNGFVDISFSGSEIARASFELSDPLVAAELDRVANGFDGYSSLQNFIPSISDLGNGLMGSPGESGSSARLFKRPFQGSGLYLVSAPGVLPESLNRMIYADINDLSGNAINKNEILPGQPFIMLSNGNEDESFYIYAEETGLTGNRLRPVKWASPDGNYAFLSAPASKNINLMNLVNELDQPVTPALQIWDGEKQRFRIQYGSSGNLSSWDAMIVNRDVPEPSRILASDKNVAEPAGMNRLITLRLFEEMENRVETPVDESMISFLGARWSRDDKRYDLPKFYPLRQAVPGESAEEFTFMYLKNPQSNQRLNSFTHLPYDPDRDYQVTVGLSSTRSSVQSVLRWTLSDEIPDEWIVTLEDRFTGQTMNMRDQSSYAFRHSFRNQINREDFYGKPFTEMSGAAEDRFTILIKPFESPLGSNQESERPGTVELRQNYPNPFNPATSIVYFLPEERQVRIGIYNVVGQPVAMLVDDVKSAGEHSESWNASDMPSGIYIVQLESGNQIFTRKITLIK